MPMIPDVIASTMASVFSPVAGNATIAPPTAVEAPSTCPTVVVPVAIEIVNERLKRVILLNQNNGGP